MIGVAISVIAIGFAMYFFNKYWALKEQEFKKSPEEDRFKAMFNDVLADQLSSLGDKFSKVGQEVKDSEILSNIVTKLREEKTKLEIEMSKKTEEYARKEREIEHKAGLIRQDIENQIIFKEKELDLKLREATVKVKEDNLATERKLFTDNLAASQAQFKEEVVGQRKLLESLIGRFTVKETTTINK